MEKEEFVVKVPPIKSQGKKTKLVEWIKGELDLIEKDEHYVFIEPFVGTGAVGFNIAPRNAIFSDINPHLINFYKAIKEKSINSIEVKKFLTHEGALLLANPDYYYTLRERFNKEASPLDFLFLTRSCFNGMMRFNRTGGFNVPFCKKPERFSVAYVTKICNQVKWLEGKILNNNWEFYNCDFKPILETNKNNKDAIYYLDAPYVLRHTDYFNGWGAKEEVSLYEALKAQEGQFILSTWVGNEFRQNPYIESLWSEFAMVTKGHTYHVGAKVSNRPEIIEALVIKRNKKES